MSDRNGTLTVHGDRAVLTFERRLPYPVEAVWSAITDPDERREWFGATVIEPRTGGRIEMDPIFPDIPADAKRMTGRITVWDPPHVLEHEWHQSVVEPSVVRYELHPENGGTRLTFTHRGLGVDNANGFRPGTHAYLDRLEAHLAGAPLPDWDTRYREVAESLATKE
ncbi:Activator of Hsp90 ATPase homolog 1-like protein [Mycolicibacterium phlei]|jgi:uncharacterized protein YndB with AHSA1/START domain|uniref:ATPase n=1 Tax=Mycolicibacterium phlei DSM 43239 = CCUG 21000 TaxID=1226750 RepID=A0A5N5UZ04_MYCPH|nr:SRPBCC family protein [Mycolicibacterium phlei]VEG10144.1 Activator of Hsp90 ATPase homolog 1-like protein [Mycobacteroides chelonae]AMO62039.1 hypothetical protein MPHLCCUG_03234 [Mycolicibacterium phlei]EID14199.1 hypothetical protein MPHLEI_11544 [Mycolicibacterium phlei RIVM601174]KAB7753659.1 ATPase [Mycolicibacterium phlei DSM 43239 = CCUG 21000]KXW63168.1 ATPase [Mycolicibacterium phlei DSM 43070]